MAAIRVHFVPPEIRNPYSTHYGPPGHDVDAGKEIRFTIKVENTRDFGPTLISCGELSGFKFPKKGGIPGVSVLWSPELGTPNLEKYGKVSYEPENQKTGDDGTSTLLFKPKDEVIPGFG